MAHHLAAVVAAALLLVACGGGDATMDGPRRAAVDVGDIPALTEPQFGGAGSTTALGGEQLTDVTEAAPPGLRITSVRISPLSALARQALKFQGFRTGSPSALIELPISGVNPQLGMYYLLVPVVNDGDEPVRNLKGRADFYDADGVRVWSETEPVTYFPTRLGLNPPSLPETPNIQEPGPLGSEIRGFSLYYFAGNVGLFTFAVPDPAIAATVTRWTLTFLVSTT
ncbi:MAG TPA: hypothetical protein VGB64_09375 [Actinomycetota bacterium]